MTKALSKKRTASGDPCSVPGFDRDDLLQVMYDQEGLLVNLVEFTGPEFRSASLKRLYGILYGKVDAMVAKMKESFDSFVGQEEILRQGQRHCMDQFDKYLDQMEAGTMEFTAVPIVTAVEDVKEKPKPKKKKVPKSDSASSSLPLPLPPAAATAKLSTLQIINQSSVSPPLPFPLHIYNKSHLLLQQAPAASKKTKRDEEEEEEEDTPSTKERRLAKGTRKPHHRGAKDLEVRSTVSVWMCWWWWVNVCICGRVGWQ